MGQLRLSLANRDIVILPRILQMGCVCVCMCVLTQSGLRPTRVLCPWKFPGKITGSSCHFLLQGIFPTQGWNPKSPMSPVLAGRFFTTEQIVHTSIIKLFVKGDKLHNCMSNFRNSLWSIKSQKVAALLFLKYTFFF